MAINRIKTGGITDGTITTTDIAPGTIANDRLAGSIANAKLANSAITINGTSIALGASGEIVAGTDWQAVTVADGSTQVTAEAGKGYFLDTNTGVIEVFLPTSPSRGDTVVLMDYAGTFATNNVIVNTGSNNLDSTTTREYKLDTNDTIAEFIYVDSAKGFVTRINTTTGTTPDGVFNSFGGYDTQPPTFPHIGATGGTVTTSGDFKIHTFTGDGNFVVSYAGSGANASPSIVDYLVVAGGAGGGFTPGSWGGGGGGAGGFRESLAACSPTHTPSGHTVSPLKATTGITLTEQTYPITVGGGGTAGVCGSGPGGPNSPQAHGCGGQGSNSVFSTITSAGGGYGGGGAPPNPRSIPGGSGGSGGGTAAPYAGGGSTPVGAGGAGNTPPVSPPQGNSAGTADGHGHPHPAPAHRRSASGGGGATASSSNAAATATAGGAGATTHITGSPVTYAGGGGAGGASPCAPTGAAGGAGGGGAGGRPGNSVAGTANTGGGGGGGGGCNCARNGSAGGKGIVVIRYKYQ